jgi:hypothetical protein
MKSPNENRPEEANTDKHARFLHLLKEIAAVSKAAIYELDPRLRPKPRRINRETKSEK